MTKLEGGPIHKDRVPRVKVGRYLYPLLSAFLLLGLRGSGAELTRSISSEFSETAVSAEIDRPPVDVPVVPRRTAQPMGLGEEAHEIQYRTDNRPKATPILFNPDVLAQPRTDADERQRYMVPQRFLTDKFALYDEGDDVFSILHRPKGTETICTVEYTMLFVLQDRSQECVQVEIE